MQNKPLTGIRVLDFSRLFAGPFCTMLLGDLGADVVKVEGHAGDPIRMQGPPFYDGMSMGFAAVNRNKRSICLDLKNPDDLARAQELVKTADVLVENFRPGVMERLGLGPDAMMEINPRLIYTRISGMGATGPLRDKGAFDLTIQAQAGFMSITGEKDGLPIKLGTSVFDLVCGQYAMGAITAALHHRHTTNQGTVIHTSLYEGVVTFLADAGMEWLLTGKIREKMGSEHASMVPYRAFRTADGWIAIGAAVQRHFQLLADYLGVPDLVTDPRFLDLEDRVANRSDLDLLLDREIVRFKTDRLVTDLDSLGIPCAPVNTLDQVFEHDQTHARDMVVHAKRDSGSRMPLIGSAVKYGSFDVTADWSAPPALGEDQEAVLAGWLNSAVATNTSYD